MAFVPDIKDYSTGRLSLPSVLLTVALVLMGLAAVMVVRWMWNGFPQDLSAIYMAAYVYGAGLPELMYNAPPEFFNGSPPDWLPLLPAVGLEGREVVPYVYPPLWAILLSPIAQAFGPHQFFNALAVLEMAMLMASVGLCWRMARRFALPAWAWALISLGLAATSVITFSAIIHLQPQIIVVFLVLLAFERYASGKPITAGAVLGLAAMLKLAPAALALIFLLDRQWRAFAGFTIACLSIAGFGLWIAGIQLHLDFFTSAAMASATPFVTAMTYSTEILVYTAAMALDLVPSIPQNAADFRLPEAPLFVPAINMALLVTCLGWAIWATHRLDADRRLVARLFLFSLLINLFGPLGWMHYYLPQLLLLPALIGLVPMRAGALTLIATAMMTSGLFFLEMQRYFSGDLTLTSAGTALMLGLFVAVTANLRHSPKVAA